MEKGKPKRTYAKRFRYMDEQRFSIDAADGPFSAVNIAFEQRAYRRAYRALVVKRSRLEVANDEGHERSL